MSKVWYDYGNQDGYEITLYDNKQYPQDRKIVFHLKINGNKESLTVYESDSKGWAKSSLEVPIHVTKYAAQPFVHMIMSLIGAKDFKLVQSGIRQFVWFNFRF